MKFVKELEENKVFYVVKIRTNKTEIPPNFVSPKNRDGLSSMFGYTKDQILVLYTSKKGQRLVCF